MTFDVEKGKINISDLTITGPIVVPIIRPRLMRAVPSNIAKVIGNFEEMQTPPSCITSQD